MSDLIKNLLIWTVIAVVILSLFSGMNGRNNASDEYNLGDNWKLSDYNGDLNGGNYHITFIDLSASW